MTVRRDALVHFEGPLRRKGALGLRLDPAAEPSARGVLVRACSPDGAAARAGATAGDLLVAVDGRPVRTLAEARAALAHLRVGDRCALQLARDGSPGPIELACTAEALASEPLDDPGLRLEYGTLRAHDGVLLRTVSVHPARDEPLAAIALVAGYRLDSTERLGVAHDPWRALAHALACAGYFVQRLERRGLGDSDGGPAASVDFVLEHRDERAALARLFAHPRVDPSRVALVGYSLGALHAPLLACDEPRVQALVLYGGGLDTWPEYLCAQLRRADALAGRREAETEARVRAQLRLNAELFARDRTLDEALSVAPWLRALAPALGVTSARTLFDRDVRYWQQVSRCALAGPLEQCSAAVLALWGSADWLSSREEHQRMAAVVERARPGYGAFVELAGVDHAMRACPSAADSFRGAAGAFSSSVTDAIVRWLTSRRLGAGSP